jgi:putative phosphoesterase
MLIGVFSDAHGHAAAFDAARIALEQAGASMLYFLGDSVGYIPETGVVERLMADRNVAAIAGNHEVMMLSRAPLDADQAAAYQFDKVLPQLASVQVAFLKSLPSMRRFVMDGLDLLFVHGSPTDPTFGYVYPDTDLTLFRDVGADVVFMGNTHRPFIRRSDGGGLFINVGSCGLPRDDDPRGSACIFDTVTGKARIIRYSIAAGSRSILAKQCVAAPVAEYLRRYASYMER